MVDMSAIGGALASLSAASQIAKGLLGVRDAAMIQDKIIELQAKIPSAQQSAFAANVAQSALLERVRELETEVAEVKAWETEKQRYQLADVGLGSLAYVLKPEAQDAEPVHTICPGCYQKRKKSILQHDTELGFALLTCHECRTKLRVERRSVSPVW
jgi:hypothetical protein